MAQSPVNDVARKQASQHQARQNASNKKFGNRNIGRDAIHDHDDGGRNEQTKCAGTGQGAYDHVVWITSLGQLRQGHFANGGASGCRRSRYGRKDGAPSDVGVKQAPR